MTSVFVRLLPRLPVSVRNVRTRGNINLHVQHGACLSIVEIETIESTYLYCNRITESRLWCKKTDRRGNGQMSVYVTARKCSLWGDCTFFSIHSIGLNQACPNRDATRGPNSARDHFIKIRNLYRYKKKLLKNFILLTF